ncbi:MAG: type II toxin-antitoxin system Phd/YefM family antitoxin [Caldilineaceae bacterium]|nr:type II toxin-antitoxin system Phd/YefM family antitoxin [Caldilineaceae bacterium]
MSHFSLQEAEQNLARLIALVHQGEQVVIEANGKPVAQLMLPIDASKKRQPGRDLGRFTVPNNFDDPLPDEIIEGFRQ